MKIDHIAIYVSDLEKSKNFYFKYFAGVANSGYRNPKTGLQTYFLTFVDGSRLEIMTRPELADNANAEFSIGITHLAFNVCGRDNVDKLVEKFISDGVKIKSAPRTTGDGYYEACVLDPDGNFIEIVG